LNVFSFFLLVLDISLNLFTKLQLNYSDSFFILGFHLSDDLFIHLDHLGQRLLNSVPLSFEELHLVDQYLVGNIQLSAFAGFLLNLLESGGLSVQHMFRELAGGEGEVEEGALSKFLG
jgi:hypothetical protein